MIRNQNTKTIVFATTNLNKVKRIQALLADLDVQVVSLNDLNFNIPDIIETATTCTAIAIEKALHYVSKLPKGTIVLTQDDTLVFEGIDAKDNPGIHIKEPVIDKYGEFTDINAANYYIDLANKYGGTIAARFEYGHAMAIIADDENDFIKIVAGESKLESRLVNKINKLEKSPGYFLSAIMEVKIDNNWISYNDITEEQQVKLDFDLKKSILKLLNEFK